MKKLRKIFVILSQAWDKAKNLSPLVELNLGPSDSVLKFSNHLHSGWLCWLKMKSHTSIITTQWSSNYQYVHHWISLCWKSKCKRWKLVNWYYLNELLHLNWKFLVSSVGLANTVCSVEPTANEFSKLWDCCWGALRIYLHCWDFIFIHGKANAIICTWKPYHSKLMRALCFFWWPCLKSSKMFPAPSSFLSLSYIFQGLTLGLQERLASYYWLQYHPWKG